MKKLINTYKYHLPNIKEMKRLVNGMGWTVEYEYTFTGRWLRWLCLYDCSYVLDRDDNQMRNYTS